MEKLIITKNRVVNALINIYGGFNRRFVLLSETFTRFFHRRLQTIELLVFSGNVTILVLVAVTQNQS